MKQAIIAFPLVVDADVVFARTMDYIYTVAQKGHTCKLKMLLQTKNLPAN